MFSGFKDIVIFCLFWVLISFLTSCYACYYLANENLINLNGQLSRVGNSVQSEINLDAERINNYLGDISKKISGFNVEEVYHLLSKYKVFDLSYFRNYEIGLKPMPIEDRTTLIIQGTNDKDLVFIKLDLLELKRIINKLIRNNGVDFCLQRANSTIKCLVSEHQPFSINTLISDVDLVLFFNQGYLDTEYSKIKLRTFYLFVALIITGLLIYLSTRLFFLKVVYRGELREFRKLEENYFSLQENNKDLQIEQNVVRNYLSSLKSERRLLKAFQNNITLVEHYLQLLLKPNKNENEELTKFKIEGYLQEILNYISNISNRIIVENHSSKINVGQIIELAIKFLSLKLQSNSVKCVLKNDTKNENLNIGENALLQIILSIMAFQINTLPKNRKVDIKVIKYNDVLSIIMTDNGFGLDLDMIKNRYDLASQDNIFILDWGNLEKSMTFHNINFSYSAEGRGQFILNIPIIKDVEDTLINKNSKEVDNYVLSLSSSKKH